MSASLSLRGPGNVLVLNAGSSSLKFTMYAMDNEKILAKGIVERIGLNEPFLKYERFDGSSFKEQALVSTHAEALKLVCAKLVEKDVGVLNSLMDVEAIGHRVVHGGENFHDSVIVTNEVKNNIHECAALASYHSVRFSVSRLCDRPVSMTI